MIEIKKEGILLKKRTLGFECEGVLNPAIIMEDKWIHLFFRAVGKGNYSTIGYCKLKSPLEVEERLDIPLLFPQFEYESKGIEDPRIVKIEDLYYLTYTAYDGINALGALAVSKDLHHFEKRGLIVPQMSYDEFKHLAESKGSINEKYQRYNKHERIIEKKGKKIFIWDKNVIFFPRKINGNFIFLHRVKPDIQITVVNHLKDLTLEFWQNYFLLLSNRIVLSPKHKHEVSYIGGGCPPIETKEGWLLIYHGVHDTVKGFVYSACAALLDLENPQKETARLPYALFKPEEQWELKGEVNNVCFPTGALVINDTLYIYYGAADEQIAVASLSLTALLTELLLYKEIPVITASVGNV
jgi:beta-1,2-mannobiose phosphorylase / 1,2-beta-oligomannan phosphorylase